MAVSLPPISVVSAIPTGNPPSGKGRGKSEGRPSRKQTRKGNIGKGAHVAGSRSATESGSSFSRLSKSARKETMSAWAEALLKIARGEGIPLETERTGPGERTSPRQVMAGGTHPISDATKAVEMAFLKGDVGADEAYVRFVSTHLSMMGVKGLAEHAKALRMARSMIRDGATASEVVDALESRKTSKGEPYELSPYVKRFVSSLEQTWGLGGLRTPKPKARRYSSDELIKLSRDVKVVRDPRVSQTPGGGLGNYLVSMMRTGNPRAEVLDLIHGMATANLDDRVLQWLDSKGTAMLTTNEVAYLWSHISDNPWSDPMLTRWLYEGSDPNGPPIRADEVAERIRDVRSLIPDEQKAIESLGYDKEDQWVNVMEQVLLERPDRIPSGGQLAKSKLYTGSNPSDTIVVIYDKTGGGADPDINTGAEIWWIMSLGSGRLGRGVYPISPTKGLDPHRAITYDDLRDRLMETGLEFSMVPRGHVLVRRAYGLAAPATPLSAHVGSARPTDVVTTGADVSAEDIRRLQDINRTLDDPDLTRDDLIDIAIEADTLRARIEPRVMVKFRDDLTAAVQGEYPRGVESAHAWVEPRRVSDLSEDARRELLSGLDQMDMRERMLEGGLSGARRLRNLMAAVTDEANRARAAARESEGELHRVWVAREGAPFLSMERAELESTLGEIARKWNRHMQRFEQMVDYGRELRNRGFRDVYEGGGADLERRLLDIVDPMKRAAEELRGREGTERSRRVVVQQPPPAQPRASAAYFTEISAAIDSFLAPEGKLNAERVYQVASGKMSYADIVAELRKSPATENYANDIARYLTRFWSTPQNKAVLMELLRLDDRMVRDQRITVDMMVDAVARRGVNQFAEMAYDAYRRAIPGTAPAVLPAYARGEFAGAAGETRLPSRDIEFMESLRSMMIRNPELRSLIENMHQQYETTGNVDENSWRSLLKVVAELRGYSRDEVDAIADQAVQTLMGNQ